jgi:hypothetical protein
LNSWEERQSAAGKEVAPPGMTESEHVVQDYASTSLSLEAHPVNKKGDKELLD